MPISDLHGLPAIADEIYRLHPKTVLDLGIGFGLYGAVCRQILDAQYGRCRTDQWEAKIYGVEAHSPYLNPMWSMYTQVEVADFTETDRSGYDLVLMIDSLEHLDPEVGRAFLDRLVAHNKNVIISVPVEYCPQEATFGNEYETHRTHYQGNEFARHDASILHRGLCQVMSIRGKL